MIPSRSNPEALDVRTQAARLLRTIRALPPDQAAEHVGWAHMLLPDRVSIIRLAIDLNLALSNTQEADALIARALILHPRNLSLRLRRARCLLLTNREYLAAVELRYLAQARPSHVATLHLAAQTMRAIDHLDLSAQFLRRAAACCPADDRLSERIVRDLLTLNLIPEADRLLHHILSPAPVLRARVLHAQGRLLESLELLQSALSANPTADRDESLTLLFQLHHQLGMSDRLHDLLRLHPDLAPPVADAAARAFIATADPRTAARLCVRALRKNRRLLPTLGPTLMVALLALKRSRLARRLLSLIRASSPSADAPRFLPVWPNYFSAVITRQNITGNDANADPNPSVLDALLRHSLHALDSSLKAPCTLPSTEFADLSRLRERCALALHQVSASPADLEIEPKLDPLPFPSATESIPLAPLPSALAA